MLASGFQAAFDQCGAGKASDRSDVRNRTFRLGRNVAFRTSEMSIRAAHSVATIQDEMRLDTRRGDGAVRDGMVDAIDGVLAELCCQRALRMSRSRKHHKTARILIEAVNHAERDVNATPAQTSQQCSSVVDDRFLVSRLIGDAEHSGRFVDDDHVAVVKHDCTLGKRTGPELACSLIDGNDRIRRDTRSGVEAALAIYRDPPLSA